jgi:cold shock protein
LLVVPAWTSHVTKAGAPKVRPHEMRSRSSLRAFAFPTFELPGRACGPFDRLVTLYWKGQQSMRITGTMKFYNSAKGFGFVQPDDGSKDVFVHATALEAAGIRMLNEGDKISFVLEDDRSYGRKLVTA